MIDDNVNESNLSLNYQKLELSDKEYNRFAELIYKVSGISLGDNKKELVKTRFQKIIRRLKLTSFNSYYEYILAQDTSNRMSEMIDAISTNHTFFFREKAHFNFLENRIIPELLAAKQKERNHKIRVWCAASSSGEEPYSLAITLFENIENISAWDCKFLATDISTKVLKKANQGIYTKKGLETVDSFLKERYFNLIETKPEKLYQVKDFLREFIAFRRFNLIADVYPFKGRFDFIFCRNVMIYFDRPTQDKIIMNMLKFLEPNGYFIIGHSENITSDTRKFLKPIIPAVYQKIV